MRLLEPDSFDAEEGVGVPVVDEDAGFASVEVDAAGVCFVLLIWTSFLSGEPEGEMPAVAAFAAGDAELEYRL